MHLAIEAFFQTTLILSVSFAFVPYQVWLHEIKEENVVTRNEDSACSRYLSALHGLIVLDIYVLHCVAYCLLFLEHVGLRDKYTFLFSETFLFISNLISIHHFIALFYGTILLYIRRF
jgi:hypothetical protein